MKTHTVTINGQTLRVEKDTKYRAGGRNAGLPKFVTIGMLNKFFGFRASSGDPAKVTHEWRGLIGGADVSVWDYRGTKWSVGGSQAGMALLAMFLGVELER